MRPPVAAAMRLADRDMRIGKECVAPLLMEPTARSGAELGIAFAQKPERVLVVAEPDMQTVFFDPSRPATAGRAFAAESPAGLIDRQLISPFVLRARQFERRGHRGAASADHRDFDRPRSPHCRPRSSTATRTRHGFACHDRNPIRRVRLLERIDAFPLAPAATDRDSAPSLS